MRSPGRAGNGAQPKTQVKAGALGAKPGAPPGKSPLSLGLKASGINVTNTTDQMSRTYNGGNSFISNRSGGPFDGPRRASIRGRGGRMMGTGGRGSGIEGPKTIQLALVQKPTRAF